MRVLRAQLCELVEAFGEPDIIEGRKTWDIAHEGTWIEMTSTDDETLFQVRSQLGYFTKQIPEEVAFKKAFINYFDEI